MLPVSTNQSIKKDGSLTNVKLGSVYIIRPPFVMRGWSIGKPSNDPSLMIAIPIAIRESFTSFYVVCVNVKIRYHPVIEYYLKNSEVISAFHAIAHGLKLVFKQIRRYMDIITTKYAVSYLDKEKTNKATSKRKRSGKRKREEELAKICKGAIDKILGVIDATGCTSMTIGKRVFSLFNGRIECSDKHLAKMRLCYIKRLMDISEWPHQAIMWWTEVHLRIPGHKLPPQPLIMAAFVKECQQASIISKMSMINLRKSKKDLSNEERQTPDIREQQIRSTYTYTSTPDTINANMNTIVSPNPCAELCIENQLMDGTGHDITFTHASNEDLESGRAVRELGEREEEWR